MHICVGRNYYKRTRIIPLDTSRSGYYDKYSFTFKKERKGNECSAINIELQNKKLEMKTKTH